MTKPVVTPTVAGATPLAWLSLTGLGCFGAMSTGLMLTCHLQLGYGQCRQARQEWGEQMTATGAGFALLFVSAPAGVMGALLRRRHGAAAEAMPDPVPAPEWVPPLDPIEPPPNPVDRWTMPADAPPVRSTWLPWRR